MKKQISSRESRVKVEGVSLAEIHKALREGFGVRITVPALRQTMLELDVEPKIKASGRSGRGRSFYYDYSVLWLLAAVYHAVYGPKAKLREIRARLRQAELAKPEGFSISEFYTDEGDEPVNAKQRDHGWLREVYMALVTDPDHGLDLRVVTDVAQSHANETGLGDKQIHDALLMYKRQTLMRLGVPAGVANKVSL